MGSKLLIGFGVGCFVLVLCSCLVAGAVMYEANRESSLYQQCQDEAYDNYIQEWNSKCPEYGIGEDPDPDSESECTLPQEMADDMKDALDKAYERCDQEYWTN